MTFVLFAVAMIVALGIYDSHFKQYVLAQEHPDRNKFHAEVAHALLE